MTDETFGPILPIVTYKTINEVLANINTREKPLALYYFGKNSQSNENLIRLRDETSSGAFIVNELCLHMSNSYLPFGGVGGSGYGRIHGKEGFNQCSNLKSVLYKSPINMYPFTAAFPPYTPEKQKVIRFLASKLDLTQAQLGKRFVWFLVALWIFWLIATKRITMKKIRTAKNMAKMMFQMM